MTLVNHVTVFPALDGDLRVATMPPIVVRKIVQPFAHRRVVGHNHRFEFGQVVGYRIQEVRHGFTNSFVQTLHNRLIVCVLTNQLTMQRWPFD